MPEERARLSPERSVPVEATAGRSLLGDGSSSGTTGALGGAIWGREGAGGGMVAASSRSGSVISSTTDGSRERVLALAAGRGRLGRIGVARRTARLGALRLARGALGARGGAVGGSPFDEKLAQFVEGGATERAKHAVHEAGDQGLEVEHAATLS